MATKKKKGKKGNWAWTKTMKKGALHRDLGVPEDQKIPPSKIQAAAKRKDVVGRRARTALLLMKVAKRARARKRRSGK